MKNPHPDFSDKRKCMSGVPLEGRATSMVIRLAITGGYIKFIEQLFFC